MYLSPLMLKSCAGHNSHTVWHNLIMFGKDIYQVKQVYSMQEGQLLLCWFFFYPIKHTGSSLTLTRHLFLLLFLRMCTHKLKVFTNIVYPVQIITSKITIRWFWQNKIKKDAKIKSLTVHLLLFSLIILARFHSIFASFYFALFQYVHDIWLKYYRFRNGGLVGEFASSSDGYFLAELSKIWKCILSETKNTEKN